MTRDSARLVGVRAFTRGSHRNACHPLVTRVYSFRTSHTQQGSITVAGITVPTLECIVCGEEPDAFDHFPSFAEEPHAYVSVDITGAELERRTRPGEAPEIAYLFGQPKPHVHSGTYRFTAGLAWYSCCGEIAYAFTPESEQTTMFSFQRQEEVSTR